MKRILLAAALLVAASSAFAEWKLLDSNNKRDLYFDVSRVRMEGKLVNYWTLSSDKVTQTEGGVKSRSDISLNQIDCQSEKYRLLSVTSYSDVMGRGTITSISKDLDLSIDIIPGTITEAIFKNLCTNKK